MKFLSGRNKQTLSSEGVLHPDTYGQDILSDLDWFAKLDSKGTPLLRELINIKATLCEFGFKMFNST